MKLSEIREACEKASPGPWEASETPPEGFGGSIGAWDVCVGDCLLGDLFGHGADARFIALARTALPALLEAVDAVMSSGCLGTRSDAVLIVAGALRRAGIEVDE